MNIKLAIAHFVMQAKVRVKPANNMSTEVNYSLMALV